MSQIKAVVIAAACALALPAIAAEAPAPKQAPAKAEAKQATPKQKVAGDVSAPVEKQELEVVKTAEPKAFERFTLAKERWVHTEEKER